ncbi:MAG: c-type cytochrome [Pseudohongiellaceae bacterium]
MQLFDSLSGHGNGRLICIILLLLAGGSTLAQELNPLEADRAAIRAGAALYRGQCATCHGADAKGISDIDAPDLTLVWTASGTSDGAVYATIRDGIPGSIMPSHGFSDNEIWMVVAYLKSIGVSGSAEPVPGRPDRGRDLFATHCAQCHRVGGHGGSLGPDLTGVPGRRSIAALTQSVRQPSAVIARGYRPVSLVTRENRHIRGTVKSEDAFSLQIMDDSQQLRGFFKADLVQVDRGGESLMPAFSSEVLIDDDLLDILSYLDARN